MDLTESTNEIVSTLTAAEELVRELQVQIEAGQGCAQAVIDLTRVRSLLDRAGVRFVERRRFVRCGVMLAADLGVDPDQPQWDIDMLRMHAPHRHRCNVFGYAQFDDRPDIGGGIPDIRVGTVLKKAMEEALEEQE